MTGADEIRDLAMRYSDAVGRLDAAAAAATYADEGVLSAFALPDIVGRAAIAAALEETLGPLAFLSQQCCGLVLSLDGEVATARWTVQEWFVRQGEDQLRCCFGTYEDVVRRSAEGWRFLRRRFHPYWRGKVSSEGRLYTRPDRYEAAD